MAEGEQGWIAMDRATAELLWPDPGLFRVWVACLIWAAYQPRRVSMPCGSAVHLAVGEFVTTREAFGRRINGGVEGEPVASARTIWRWLVERLGERHGLVDVMCGERWTIVRVRAMAANAAGAERGGRGEKEGKAIPSSANFLGQSCPGDVPDVSRSGVPVGVPSDVPAVVPNAAAAASGVAGKEIGLFDAFDGPDRRAVVPAIVPADVPAIVPNAGGERGGECPADVPYKNKGTRKNKNSKSLNPSTGAVDDAGGFGQFWSLYPKKVAKIDAVKVWPAAVKAAGGGPVGVEAVLAGLARQIEVWRRDGTAVQHMANPARWLRGARWTDELAAGTGAGAGKAGGHGGQGRGGGGGMKRSRSHYTEERR